MTPHQDEQPKLITYIVYARARQQVTIRRRLLVVKIDQFLDDVEYVSAKLTLELEPNTVRIH